MDISKINRITPYQDVNTVLLSLAQGIESILGGNLLGLYLTGSLSYGDFNPGSSDIDLVAILNSPASPKELKSIQALHVNEGQEYPKWAKRIECSYTPIAMLSNILPPEAPRPYYGEGIFYPEARYGNEWIINLYWLHKHGIALVGPEFKALTAQIDMVDVQKACIRDLFREWEPKITDPTWLNNSHYQSYIVLNLCRILYTVTCSSMGSKKVSASWVKGKYSEWIALIQTAENWQYGTEMNRRAEAVEFIKFVINQVVATELYRQIRSSESRTCPAPMDQST
jgi:hypothetical protein